MRRRVAAALLCPPLVAVRFGAIMRATDQFAALGRELSGSGREYRS
jgi:hypothetical protein